MITDEEAKSLTDYIRAAATALNERVAKARSSGLRVDLSVFSDRYCSISEDPDADRSKVKVNVFKRIPQ